MHKHIFIKADQQKRIENLEHKSKEEDYILIQDKIRYFMPQNTLKLKTGRLKEINVYNIYKNV